MTVTFFGHRDTPSQIQPVLEKTLIDLIENRGANVFYVGNQGEFDRMVLLVLRKLKAMYPQISYAVVLAYFPDKRTDVDYSETLFPDGLEYSVPKFAISNRNRWMIDSSEAVVTYVKHTYGGAASFEAIAQRKGKFVINPAETNNAIGKS